MISCAVISDVHGVAIGFDVEVPLGANFNRFRLARLQAESSRNMYSLQGLLALIRAVFLRGVPAVDGGVVLHAGIAAVPGGFGNLVEQVFGFEGFDRAGRR